MFRRSQKDDARSWASLACELMSDGLNSTTVRALLYLLVDKSPMTDTHALILNR